MAVTFSLEKRTDKKGDAPIRVSIVIFGKRFQTSVGFSVRPDPEIWDGKQVKQGYSNSRGITYSTINTKLTNIVEHFTRFENQYFYNREFVTVEVLKQEYQANFEGKKKTEVTEITFWNYFDLFAESEAKDKDWTPSTIAKFKGVKKHLEAFGKDLTFDSFDTAGLSRYRKFLLTDRHLRNTTIEKQMKFLKWFLRWAVKHKYSTNVDFVGFAPKKDKKKTADKRIVFLDQKELMKVYNFKLPEKKNYLERVRDVFCFCCFTGLRYSDVAILKKSDIKKESIQFTSTKTGDKLTVELNKYSKAILDKYKDVILKNDQALPVISNQKSNTYIKELAGLCGINEPTTVTYYVGDKRIDETKPKSEYLGTHTGRRTFICTSLALGIPATTIMKWTGHSDFKAMQPYVDVADKTKAQKMRMFNRLK